MRDDRRLTGPVTVNFAHIYRYDRDANQTIAAVAEEGSGIPWWTWLVLALAILLCLLMSYCLYQYSTQKKVSKREAVAKKPKKAPPAEEEFVASVSPSREPLMMMAAPPIAVAPPVQTYQMVQPRMVQQPVQMVQQPVQLVQQVQQPVYVAPARYVEEIVVQGPNLFDVLDRDHDGVLSREEYAALQQGVPTQAVQVPTYQVVGQ